MTRIRTHTIASVLFVALAFAGGAGRGWALEVNTDFDPGTNFAMLRTYYWAKGDPVPTNDIVNQRIVATVDQWLMSKGWSKAPKEQADVAIAAHVATQQKQSLDTFYPAGPWGGWGWGGWGGVATTTVRTYLEGTLVIDMFNAKTNKLIWRGTATDTVSDDPEKNTRHIQKAIQKMFEKKFPPGVVED